MDFAPENDKEYISLPITLQQKSLKLDKHFPSTDVKAI